MDFPAPILQFDLEGPMGHFKKYYSNASSLTYEVPPRTVIMGMLGSLLECPRDSYYEKFHPENCKIGVGLRAPTRKLMQCMNYRVKGGGRTQIRLELLLPHHSKLRFRVYVSHEKAELLDELSSKIQSTDPGFGLYFGQRPFRAYATDPKIIGTKEVTLQEESSALLQTLTYEENVRELHKSEEFRLDVTNVSMPLSMKQVADGREPEDLGNITYERSGQQLPGTFDQVIVLDGKPISFFTPV